MLPHHLGINKYEDYFIHPKEWAWLTGSRKYREYVMNIREKEIKSKHISFICITDSASLSMLSTMPNIITQT